MMPVAFSRGAAKQTTYLSKTSVAALASRPGMAVMADLLQLPLAAKVPVLSLVTITAELDCGAHVRQQLRSNPSFRGAPWYDAVLYRVCSGDGTGVNGEAEDSGSTGTPTEGSSVGQRSEMAGAGGKNSADLCIGEVRAIVRHPDGDYAYVREWAPVEAEPGCSLGARGCQRLCWSFPENSTDAAVREVPLAHIKRLVHVVPDFADLLARKGINAEPPSLHGAVHEHRAMRFFVNPFYPWV